MHLFRLNESTTANFCLSNANIFAGDLRLFLVGILGSLISIFSIGQNILLFYVFSTSRKLRRQNYVNPVMLAFFDIFVSSIYLLISPTHFLAHRLNSIALASLWSKNMRILYCLEHFALTVCNFLLVIASIERFLANSTRYSQRCVLVFIVRHKPYVFVAILVFSFLLKATLFFEIGLFEVPECANLTESLIPVWLAENASASQSIRFWTRNLLTIILPFLILAYCNFKIVQQLRKRRRMTLIGASGEYSCSLASQTNQNFAEKQSKANRIISTKITNQQSNSEPQAINRQANDLKWHQNVKLAEDGSGAIMRQMMRENGKLEDKRITFIKKNALPMERISRKISKSESECPPPNRPNQQYPPIDGQKTSLLGNSASMPNVGPTSISSPNSNFGVRIATRTLVMVVGCYLISNSMSTILNIWEYFDVKFLRHDNFHAYLIASDIAALLTICGCALRLPIYVSNDKRIRKAICRAFIRFRFGCTKKRAGQIANGEGAEQFLEKYSIVIVSNSLRSNLTGALSQLDWATFQGKRSFDQLAILVQNRRKFLVQMTINLGAVQELRRRKSGDGGEESENGEEEHQRAATSLTEIHECTIFSEDCGKNTENESE